MTVLNPTTEQSRLEALARYAVINTLPETAFDRIAALAARLFRTPIALVSLVDEEHQFFKACLGLDLRQTSRELSFCAHALDASEVLVVQDARQDPRFRDNALVTGHPHIRFYAGAPLETHDGFRLGTLCIIDTVPRPDLTADERGVLQDLAALVMDELELRLRGLQLERESQANALLMRSLRDSHAYSEVLLGVSELLLLQLPPMDLVTRVLELVSGVARIDWGNLSIVRGDEASIAAVWAANPEGEMLTSWIPSLLKRGTGALWHVLDQQKPHFVDRYETHPDSVPELRGLGITAVAWLPLGHFEDQSYIVMFTRLRRNEPWSAEDRALLEAAARSLRASLSNQERRRMMHESAFTDPLTSLGNRQALDAALKALPAQGLAGLASISLAGYRSVLEAEGQARGDALVRLFAIALSSDLAGGVQLFRTGANEFALVSQLGQAMTPSAWQCEVETAIQSALPVLRLAHFSGVTVQTGTAIGNEAAGVREALELAERRRYEQRALQRPAPEASQDRTVQVERPLPTQPTLDDLMAAPVRCGPLVLYPARQTVRVLDREVRLNLKETQVLAVLASSPEQMFSRADLCRTVWNRTAEEAGNALNLSVSSLRKKLLTLTSEYVIRSVRLGGYVLRVPPRA